MEQNSTGAVRQSAGAQAPSGSAIVRTHALDLRRQEAMRDLAIVVDQAELASRWIAQLDWLGDGAGRSNPHALRDLDDRRDARQRAAELAQRCSEEAVRACGAAAQGRLPELRGIREEVEALQHRVRAYAQQGGLWMGHERLW